MSRTSRSFGKCPMTAGAKWLDLGLPGCTGIRNQAARKTIEAPAAYHGCSGSRAWGVCWLGACPVRAGAGGFSPGPFRLSGASLQKRASKAAPHPPVNQWRGGGCLIPITPQGCWHEGYKKTRQAFGVFDSHPGSTQGAVLRAGQKVRAVFCRNPIPPCVGGPCD